MTPRAITFSYYWLRYYVEKMCLILRNVIQTKWSIQLFFEADILEFANWGVIMREREGGQQGRIKLIDIRCLQGGNTRHECGIKTP